uniref:Adenylate kinase n=1 Tax=Macrostomum lignano TaxID=282301 RepID=A0A1I8F4Q4_9PLAT
MLTSRRSLRLNSRHPFKAAAAHRRSPDRAARLRERSSIPPASETIRPLPRGHWSRFARMSNNGSVKLQTEQGRLVDDKLVSDLVSRDLDRPQCSAGFVLDGFPRTIGQAERLDSMLAERSRQLDAVVQLDLSPSWRPSDPPKRPGHDNETGEPLAMRPDDFPDVMQRRLASHFESSAPVLQRYERLGLLSESMPAGRLILF